MQHRPPPTMASTFLNTYGVPRHDRPQPSD
jgi:hypothetical protein